MLNFFKKLGISFLACILCAAAAIFIIAICLAPELTMILIVLKLVGVITFGWFYVFLPLVLSTALFLIYMIIWCMLSMAKN